MKTCPKCQTTFPQDANFCPEEDCATADGPERLIESSGAALTDAEAEATYGLSTTPAANAPDSAAVFAQDTTRTAQGRYKLGPLLRDEPGWKSYRAIDTEDGSGVIYREIAAPVISGGSTLARVERECKQIMRAQSENVVVVTDCGRDGDELFVVSTDYPGAQSLARVLADRKMLPLDEAKVIIGQAARGLLDAQRLGIVHRDVSAENILVLADGSVRVKNFALAPADGGEVAGTAAYMAPEVISGKPHDQRSNAYALAGVLYHAVTGSPPFVPAAGADGSSVLNQHQSSPLLPPSQRNPDVDIPVALDKLIAKAMDKPRAAGT